MPGWADERHVFYEHIKTIGHVGDTNCCMQIGKVRIENADSMHVTMRIREGHTCSCDDGHMHAPSHEVDDVADHLAVMLHVGAVSVQGAISIEGDQPKGASRSMHLHTAPWR